MVGVFIDFILNFCCVVVSCIICWALVYKFLPLWG